MFQNCHLFTSHEIKLASSYNLLCEVFVLHFSQDEMRVLSCEEWWQHVELVFHACLVYVSRGTDLEIWLVFPNWEPVQVFLVLDLFKEKMWRIFWTLTKKKNAKQDLIMHFCNQLNIFFQHSRKAVYNYLSGHFILNS